MKPSAILSLNPNDGEILYSRKMDGYNIEVHEKSNLRWLYFGGKGFQSVIDLSRPAMPTISYCSSMLAALAFKPNPSSVLNIGVGGGTFERFFNTYYPCTPLISIESQEVIVQVARRFFYLPKNGVIYNSRIEEYVIGCDKNFDIILCDVVDGVHCPPFLCDSTFYQHVFRILSVDGVLTLNILPSSKDQMIVILMAVRKHFNSVVLLDFSDSKNILLYCSKKSTCSKGRLMKRIDALAEQYDFEFSKYFSRLRCLPKSL